MSFVTYFKSYPNPYYGDWREAPVPGWGVRPVMAGPRMVAVGAFDAESAGCGTNATDFKATQNMLKEVGITDAENKPIVADGDFGNRSKQAFAKWEARFKADPKFGQLGISLPCDGLFYEAECKRDPAKCKAGEGAVPQTTTTGQAQPTSAPAATPSAPPRTKLGEKGPQVKAWQGFLIAKGYNLGPGGADGDHGQKTEEASLDWEKKQSVAAEQQRQEAQKQAEQAQQAPKAPPRVQFSKAAREFRRYGRYAPLLAFARPKPPSAKNAGQAQQDAARGAGGRTAPDAGRGAARTPAKEEAAKQQAQIMTEPLYNEPTAEQAEIPIYKKPLFYVGVAAALGVVGFAAYSMTRKT